MSHIDAWLKIGKKNPWIKLASDPPFTKDSFRGYQTCAELVDAIKTYRCWSLGVAFYWKNICLINQDEGGSEFLVIKDDLGFESFSVGYMTHTDLADHLERINRATREQCETWEY